jgi:hypothetical protein
VTGDADRSLRRSPYARKSGDVSSVTRVIHESGDAHPPVRAAASIASNGSVRMPVDSPIVYDRLCGSMMFVSALYSLRAQGSKPSSSSSPSEDPKDDEIDSGKGNSDGKGPSRRPPARRPRGNPFATVVAALEARFAATFPELQDRSAVRPAPFAERGIRRGMSGRNLEALLRERYLPLTGLSLRQFLRDLYGYEYDVQPVRRNILGKYAVYMQVMWEHTLQGSFRLTQKQYVEHLQAIADILNAYDGADMHFLREVYRSKREPVVGMSVSIRLPMVDPAHFDEIFRPGS